MLPLTTGRFSLNARCLLLVTVLALTVAVASPVDAAGIVTDCTSYGFAPGTLAHALLGGGKVTFACDGTIAVPEIVILGDTTLDAAGHAVILSGSGFGRVIVAWGARLELLGLVLTNGRSDCGGGLLAAAGATVDLTDSHVRGNSASFGGGGLCIERSILTLTDSTVSGNSAGTVGGGLVAVGNAMVTVLRSTVSGNSAGFDGGGVESRASRLALEESTVSGNVSRTVGGGLNVRDGSTIALTNVTVSDNSAVSAGGGVSVQDATVVITSSTVTANSAAFGGGLSSFSISNVALTNSIVAKQRRGSDCGGAVTSRGHNLDSDWTCGLIAPGDRPGVDPLLGPLQDNGGPTMTTALLPGSPAIDAIAPGVSGCGTSHVADQRGVLRPLAGGCDIGAFEYQPPGMRLAALGPAKLWIGLKNSDAVGLRLDVRVEAYIDGVRIGEGQLDDVPAGSSGFNNAVLRDVPLALSGEPVAIPEGSRLWFRASVRRTCAGAGHNSGVARLWFNEAAIDTGAGRRAGSRFEVTTDDATFDYLLRSAFALDTRAGSTRNWLDVAVESASPCPERPFRAFGAWATAP